ncbi:MAG TPA: hypothetical protein VGK40_07950 [Verrucomicrobiae bacterium]|jgi:hypothetical protein
MKNVEYCYVRQGSANKGGLGWFRRIGVLALSVVCLLSPLSLSSGHAKEMILTEFQYLQWLAQIAGATGMLPPNPTAADYVAWATAAGIVPNAGWQPNALMTEEVYAQTMADLLGIMLANPTEKNLERALKEENIKVPDKITTKELMKSIEHSQFGTKPKKTHVTGEHTSKPPDHPPTTDGHGTSGHHSDKVTTKPPKDTKHTTDKP